MSRNKARCRTLRDQRGQGMTEYVIVVALIGIASIGVTTIFGGDVRSLYGAVTEALAGGTSVASQAHAAPSSMSQPKGLGDFARNN